MNDSQAWRCILLDDIPPPRPQLWPAFRALRENFCTLGDLADAEAIQVERIGWVGPHTVKIFAGIIRRAMAGQDVTAKKPKTVLDIALATPEPKP